MLSRSSNLRIHNISPLFSISEKLRRRVAIFLRRKIRIPTPGRSLFFPECESFPTPDRAEIPSFLRAITLRNRMRTVSRRGILPLIWRNPNALTDTRILPKIPRPDRRKIFRIKRFETGPALFSFRYSDILTDIAIYIPRKHTTP